MTATCNGTMLKRNFSLADEHPGKHQDLKKKPQVKIVKSITENGEGGSSIVKSKCPSLSQVSLNTCVLPLFIGKNLNYFPLLSDVSKVLCDLRSLAEEPNHSRLLFGWCDI